MSFFGAINVLIFIFPFVNLKMVTIYICALHNVPVKMFEVEREPNDFYKPTSQEKLLDIASFLVVNSPSNGPKCIPGDNTGPWLMTPIPALGILDLPIMRPKGRVRRALCSTPTAVEKSSIKDGPLILVGPLWFWKRVRHSSQPRKNKSKISKDDLRRWRRRRCWHITHKSHCFLLVRQYPVTSG